MQLIRAITQLTSQSNDLPNDQFRDAARVTEGRVEHCNAIVGGALEVDLVRSDAEAADDDEVFGFLQHARRKFGL